MIENKYKNVDYVRWSNYKGLAGKQADRMYKTLIDMHARGCEPEEFQAYYGKLHKSYLYNKAPELYCQRLSDVHKNKKVKNCNKSNREYCNYS